jgi:hypothetical protein
MTTAAQKKNTSRLLVPSMRKYADDPEVALAIAEARHPSRKSKAVVVLVWESDAQHDETETESREFDTRWESQAYEAGLSDARGGRQDFPVDEAEHAAYKIGYNSASERGGAVPVVVYRHNTVYTE